MRKEINLKLNESKNYQSRNYGVKKPTGSLSEPRVPYKRKTSLANQLNFKNQAIKQAIKEAKNALAKANEKIIEKEIKQRLEEPSRLKSLISTSNLHSNNSPDNQAA